MMSNDQKRAFGGRRPVIIAAAAAISLAVVGAAVWANEDGKPQNLFAQLGGGPRPLPTGAIQVDDIAADPLGYTGPVTLRGVVASADDGGSYQFVLIDSREAKICKSGGCAKFYLPVSTAAAARVAKWDELDVRGHLVRGESYPVFQASSVTNLGSIQ